jgi:PadR family transcriptional regulator, regulatory protein PadR
MMLRTMGWRAVMTLETNLVRGTLTLLILKSLSQGPLHGFAVLEWIEAATRTPLFVAEGTLYPALHRLERNGLIEAEWGVSDNNRRAKYYSLTARGSAELRTALAAWNRHVATLERALSYSASA